MKKLAALALLALLGSVSFAAAQTPTGLPVGPGPVPRITSISAADLFQDVVGGNPQALSYYVTAGQIASIDSYNYVVPLTAFALTVPNGVKLELINPAGTLATGAFTLQASPSDGQVTCLMSSQTQTAVTVAANTTVNPAQALATYGLGALTAMTANTKYCYLYIASQSVWVRTQ